MTAVAVFTSSTSSHPFQERRVTLTEPAKIGRSVAQVKPGASNTIFDCKVLSRNHALLWYDSGKFYLQDTKSSNGTFVNGTRLSKGSEESVPTEIWSGDTIQFGVDVVENSRKVTHNCIIATVELFHPSGQEAKNCVIYGAVTGHSLHTHEIYKLAQYLQEAVQREQALENKLVSLQRLLQSTQEATEGSWQALIDEDRLVSRLECLEDQLSLFSKNSTDSELRQQAVNLLADKASYEAAAKESMKQLLDEKLEAVRKLTSLEMSVESAESECRGKQTMCANLQSELISVAAKFEKQTTDFNELTDQLQSTESQYKTECSQLRDEINKLQTKLTESIAQTESLQAEKSFIAEQMTNYKATLDCVKKTDCPKISESTSRGIQVDLVNLLDLQMLSNGDSSHSDDDDDDRDNANWKTSSSNGPVISLMSVDSLSACKSHNIDCEDDVSLLKSKLLSYKDQLHSCTSQLEDTQMLVNMLRDEIRCTESMKQSQAARIQALEEEIQNSEAEKSAQLLKVQSLEGEVRSLREMLDGKRPVNCTCNLVSAAVNNSPCSASSNPSEVAADEIASLQRECNELHQKVRDIELLMQKCREQNEELKAERCQLEASYRDVQQLKDRLLADETAHRSNLSDTQTQLELSQTQVATLTNELGEIRQQHSDELASVHADMADVVDDYATLSFNSRVLSYCATIPLALLLLVVLIACHPVLSVLTATTSPT